MNANGNGHGNFSFGEDFSNLLPDRAEMECEEMFLEADRLLTEGVVMQAVEKLAQIIKRNPRFGKAFNHLGWVYETKYKDMARAEQYYKAAMEYAPTYNASFLNYCYFLSNQGRFDELKTHLDRVSQLPGIARDTIFNEYGMMYEMQGDPHTASDYYQKAAMMTLDMAKLDKYRDSIDRCRKKLEIMNPRQSY